MHDSRVALVTGAARGIGAEVARQIAQAGYEVIITARNFADATLWSDTLRAEGMTTRALQLDIDDASSLAELERALHGQRLDMLINNAAAFADWTETATTVDLNTARSVMDTNLFGTWGVIQAALPALRRSEDARIVNVGSGSGSHGDTEFGLATSPASASYAVSKAALHALTVKLAAELEPAGIRVDAVDPGLTATAPGMEAMGARPIADGARSIVTAALQPAHSATGTFTRDGRPLPW